VNDRRWDPDPRGHGVADAGALAAGVLELAGTLAVEDWIAEEPEAHLLPHIRSACERAGLELVGHELEGAVLVVRVASPGEPPECGVHEAVFRVVGSFAESATSVRQRGRTYEVVTGLLDGDTVFKSHGHMVRIELVAPE